MEKLIKEEQIFSLELLGENLPQKKLINATKRRDFSKRNTYRKLK